MNKILRDEDFKRKFPIKLVEHNREWVHWYEYERLKLDLELMYKYDREGYTAGKTKFIKDIIKIYSLHK